MRIVPSAILPTDITLGIVAGGRASRLGGLDKAWLEREGVPQVLRWSRRFAKEHGPVLVSANRGFDRYAAHGLTVVADRLDGLGPLAALEALSAACETSWLFTLPVDLVGANDCLLRTLIATRGADGAFATDDDGPQPLVALWRRDALRPACAEAVTDGKRAVHRLAQCLDLPATLFTGLRFGNLNTPDDLLAAGIVSPEIPLP
jgi:molybdenum cofactor guanylyltransferase